MFKFIAALSGVALLSACASQPEDIQAAYVSPNIYANYSCPELFTERERLIARVNFVADAQADKATNDAVATGVGIVLFWPALFLLTAGSDREQELASLKGNYDAVELAITQRKCQLESPSGATTQVAAAPNASAARVDDSFEAQQRSINGETAVAPASEAPAKVEPQPVAVAAAPTQPKPAAATSAPAVDDSFEAQQRSISGQTAAAPAAQAEPAAAPATPAPTQQPAAAPKPTTQQPVAPVIVASKPAPVPAAAASPSIPAALYDDPNLADPVDYTRAEIREYCGQAWRIRDLTDGTFEINPCYDRRYN